MSNIVDIYVECGEILEDRGRQHKEPFAVVETAARIANTDVPSIFKALIAMKLARVESGISVHDSLIDAANYCMLWLAWKEGNYVQMATTTETSSST